MDAMLADATTAVAGYAARPPFARSDAELRAGLTELQQVATLVAAAMAALAVEAAGRALPRTDGAASAVSWLRDVLRTAPSEGNGLLALGRVLDARPGLAKAITDGFVNTSQVAAIGKVLADVPDQDPELVDKVELALVELAARFEPTVLRRLGNRVLAHVNPDLADQRLRDKLKREEEHARQRRGLTLSADGLGGIRLGGVLDVEGAAIVTAALDPLARPVTGIDVPDARTAAARQADALVEVCRIAMRAAGIPDNGGSPPQLTVTVDLEALRRRVAVGQLDTGGLLSPETTRRLACDALILPVLLDGASVPVDLGRARRTSPAAHGTRSWSVTAAAASPTVTGHPAGVRSIMWFLGWTADQPTGTTGWRCARSTTGSSTTATGRSGSAKTGAQTSFRPPTLTRPDNLDATSTTRDNEPAAEADYVAESVAPARSTMRTSGLPALVTTAWHDSNPRAVL